MSYVAPEQIAENETLVVELYGNYYMERLHQAEFLLVESLVSTLFVQRVDVNSQLRMLRVNEFKASKTVKNNFLDFSNKCLPSNNTSGSKIRCTRPFLVPTHIQFKMIP